MLKDLLRKWAVEQQPKIPKRIFTEKFQSLVEQNNKLWLQDCISNSFCHWDSNTRIHLLGTLPIQFPALYKIPFSSDSVFQSQAKRAIDEIWSDLADKGEKVPLSLVLYETREQMNWLLNDYWSLYRSELPTSNSSDLNEYLKDCQSKFIDLNQHLEIGLEVPEEWIQWMNNTGLLPKMDTIDAVFTFNEFKANTTDGPIISKVNYIGLDHAQEFEKRNLLTTKMMEQIKPGEMPIKKVLESFYEYCCGITSEEVAAISTGHMGTDSILQKMAIQPDHMVKYFDALRSSKISPDSNFTSRLVQKLASDTVIHDQIVHHIESTLVGDVKIIVIDRDVYPLLKKTFFKKGWEV